MQSPSDNLPSSHDSPLPSSASNTTVTATAVSQSAPPPLSIMSAVPPASFVAAPLVLHHHPHSHTMQETKSKYPLSEAKTPPSLKLCKLFENVKWQTGNSNNGSSSNSTNSNSHSADPKNFTSKRRSSSTFQLVPTIDTSSATTTPPTNGFNKRARLDFLQQHQHDNPAATAAAAAAAAAYYYIDQYAMPSPSHIEDDEYDANGAIGSSSGVIATPGNGDMIHDPIRQLPDMVNAYESLSQEMKSFVMFQLLKRSSTDTLQFVNSLITPALKRDFLAHLPVELALHVIRYLDVHSLCRAACVSRKWRSVIDSDATTWKRLLDQSGFLYEEEDSESTSLGSILDHHDDEDDEEEKEKEESREMAMEMVMEGDDEDDEEESQEGGAYPTQWRQAWYGADGYPAPNAHGDGPNIGNMSHFGSRHNDNSTAPSTAFRDTTRMEIDYDFGHNSTRRLPMRSKLSHPYKDIYRRHYTLRQNWRKGRAKRMNFDGHPPGTVVTCLQFDDEKIISGADDNYINIYDTKTGRRLHTLAGHDGGVWALQYLDNTLVSGSTDRTVRVWDIRRGVCTHIFLGHTSTVRCLQIIQPTMVNGRLEPSVPLIVTGSRDSTLRVWRLPDLERNETFNGVGVNRWFMHTLTGHDHSVRALAVHGKKLVSGSYDCSVCVWDVEAGRLLHRMEGHTQKVYSVVVDPARGRCMSGSMDSTVRIWDMEYGNCLRVLEGHTILVGLLGLTPNYLVSAAADASLRIWSPDNGFCRHVLHGHRGAITCFQHNEEIVISGSEGGLKMWDIKTGRHIRDLITGVTGVWRVAFDHRRCVAAVHR
ncbi:WD40-repeat-containing domain protein [Dichotomocladium elegans]|nr:WD40-repeat-containing domain protein [Dichotomocladium elegans]